jgi:sarcosine oxidase subunit alpha
MNRLDQLPTLRVDFSEKRSLAYGGKTVWGFAGDTVATALFANGVRIFGRSLKYHRPRGLYSLDGESSNTFMQVNGIPNVCAENTELKDGMRAEVQNVVGSARFDWMGFLDKLDWLMPAGFYYRTMHKPAGLWPVALKQLRKTAGLGTIAPGFRMPGRFDEIYPRADVCVVGGGAAGMSAALAAAEADLRVILIEARPHLGGCFDYRASTYDRDKKIYERARQLADQVGRMDNIRVLTRTALIGVYSNNLITAFQKGDQTDGFEQRYVEIRAESLVVATGCIERPLLFEHNEKPGVMQVGCAHRLARTYGLLPGKQAVFSVGHDLGLEAAVDLFDLGVKIACVADIRESGANPRLIEALTRRGIAYLAGWVAAEAHGVKQVKKVTLTPVAGSGRKSMACDLLVASAGMTPVNGPLILAGARLAYDAHTGFFLPTQLPEKVFAAGRITGRNHPLSIEASGRLAGLQATAACGVDTPASLKEAEAPLSGLPGPERGCTLTVAPVGGRKTFICFDEDTTFKNITQAVAMGFDVPELIKRFTAAGTGPGQGGIPGHNLPMLTAQCTGAEAFPIPTTVRPPLVPTFLAAYAGTNHDMGKCTPVHDIQSAAGGIFRRIGAWRRARYFSDDESCAEEIRNVRGNVGLLDASTLGKFRIHGPDALKALQRVYVSDMGRIRAGRIKYSAMCNDDGCVIDDGVVIRQGDDDYYFTTSTARADATVEWIRFHTRYEGWDYHLVNLTDAMGVINISGPNARKLLEKVADADVSNEAFRFAGWRDFTVNGTIPVRAMRLGFVGELSFELHAASSWMPALWGLLEEAGGEFAIRPFGVEAQNVLRMEKGHIILGQESEQRTNLLDLGLGFLWDRNKSEAKTVGAVALRQAEADPDRLKLVGIRMEDNRRAPGDGSIIVDDRIRGVVCTARKSLTTGEAVGMALVESSLAELGTRLAIYEDGCNGQLLYGDVVAMPFYDPDGRRMRM